MLFIFFWSLFSFVEKDIISLRLLIELRKVFTNFVLFSNLLLTYVMMGFSGAEKLNFVVFLCLVKLSASYYFTRTVKELTSETKN